MFWVLKEPVYWDGVFFSTHNIRFGWEKKKVIFLLRSFNLSHATCISIELAIYDILC